MFFMVIDEFDGGTLYGLGVVLAFILEDVNAFAITVTDGEVIPSGGDMWGDSQRLAVFLKAEDAFDAGLISP